MPKEKRIRPDSKVKTHIAWRPGVLEQAVAAAEKAGLSVNEWTERVVAEVLRVTKK